MKKLSEFQNDHLHSPVSHISRTAAKYIFFLLLANDFSNKNINYNQLLSDAEFHNLNKNILFKGFVAIFKLIENKCCKASITKLKNLGQIFFYASSNYSGEKTILVNVCYIFSIFRKNIFILLGHSPAASSDRMARCFCPYANVPWHGQYIAPLAYLICDPT